MRIGAIFARGSCRTLKWMASFGMVFALGAGVASAQITATLSDEVTEGGLAELTVTVKIALAESSAGRGSTVSFSVQLEEAIGTAESTDVVIVGERILSTGVSTESLNLSFRTPIGPEDDGDPDTDLTEFRTLSQTAMVQVIHDPDAEDETTRIDVTAGSPPSSNIGVTFQSDTDGDGTRDPFPSFDDPITALPLTIKDDETQTYVLKRPDTRDEVRTLMEGEARTEFSLEAVPPHEDDSIALTLHLDDPVNYKWDDDTNFGGGAIDPPASIQLGPTTATPAGVGNTQELYVFPPANDKNRVPDTVTLTAYSGTAGSSEMVASLDITYEDLHALAPGEAITAVAMDKKTGADAMEVMEVTEGGDPVYLTISVDRGKAADNDATTTEALTVDVQVAPEFAADATVTPSRVTFPAVDPVDGVQKSTTVVELRALSDEDVGMEELMLDLVLTGDDSETNGPGSSTGTFSIMIVDETAKKIAPKSEEDAYPAIEAAIEAGGGADGLNPGDTFELMTSDLFTLMDGYTASYGASVEGSSVSVSTSGEMVVVEALTAGESMITVTGTAKEASSSFQPSQSISSVADVTFAVTVTDKMLMVTAIAADPPTIDEGGTSTITATLNRAVTAGDGEVTIDLDVIGDATLDMESITIAAGAMSGSAMLTAGQDDDYDDETVTVVASGSGIDGTAQVVVSVMDDDMAPPETTYTLTASADMVAEGGDAVTITATASAMVDADTMIELAHGAGSASAGDYSLEPMMITIAAGSDSGMAMLTATDDSDVEGDETLTLNGMMGNVVVGSVMLTITDNDMAPPPAEPAVRAKDGAAMMIADAISTAAGHAAHHPVGVAGRHRDGVGNHHRGAVLRPHRGRGRLRLRLVVVHGDVDRHLTVDARARDDHRQRLVHVVVIVQGNHREAVCICAHAHGLGIGEHPGARLMQLSVADNGEREHDRIVVRRDHPVELHKDARHPTFHDLRGIGRHARHHGRHDRLGSHGGVGDGHFGHEPRDAPRLDQNLTAIVGPNLEQSHPQRLVVEIGILEGDQHRLRYLRAVVGGHVDVEVVFLQFAVVPAHLVGVFIANDLEVHPDDLGGRPAQVQDEPPSVAALHELLGIDLEIEDVEGNLDDGHGEHQLGDVRQGLLGNQDARRGDRRGGDGDQDHLAGPHGRHVDGAGAVGAHRYHIVIGRGGRILDGDALHALEQGAPHDHEGLAGVHAVVGDAGIHDRLLDRRVGDIRVPRPHHAGLGGGVDRQRQDHDRIVGAGAVGRLARHGGAELERLHVHVDVFHHREGDRRRLVALLNGDRIGRKLVVAGGGRAGRREHDREVLGGVRGVPVLVDHGHVDLDLLALHHRHDAVLGLLLETVPVLVEHERLGLHRGQLVLVGERDVHAGHHLGAPRRARVRDQGDRVRHAVLVVRGGHDPQIVFVCRVTTITAVVVDVANRDRRGSIDVRVSEVVVVPPVVDRVDRGAIGVPEMQRQRRAHVLVRRIRLEGEHGRGPLLGVVRLQLEDVFLRPVVVLDGELRGIRRHEVVQSGVRIVPVRLAGDAGGGGEGDGEAGLLVLGVGVALNRLNGEGGRTGHPRDQGRVGVHVVGRPRRVGDGHHGLVERDVVCLDLELVVHRGRLRQRNGEGPGRSGFRDGHLEGRGEVRGLALRQLLDQIDRDLRGGVRSPQREQNAEQRHPLQRSATSSRENRSDTHVAISLVNSSCAVKRRGNSESAPRLPPC